jgi:hypothetical protein
LTSSRLPLHVGDLGEISDVHWMRPTRERRTYPGFAPGDVYVNFTATTTGSPDGTIPASNHWLWGFVLARPSPTSGWVLVDQGVG